MSVITVQAAFGQLVFLDQPDQARAALGAVETTGRAALAEMRGLLGVLRDEDAELVNSNAAPVPPPTLGDLDRLADRTAMAGVRVELVVSGEPRPLPAGLELSAYRIVQEALTNVARHAGTDEARVTVTYRTDELGIEVIDHGRGSGHADGQGTGHGLLPLRELTSRADSVP